MKMYRVQTSESHWDNAYFLYGIELHLDDVKVRGTKTFNETVFEAKDDATAEEALKLFIREFGSTSGKWSASLQLVRAENGVVRRIRTLRTIIGPRKDS